MSWDWQGFLQEVPAARWLRIFGFNVRPGVVLPAAPPGAPAH